MLLGLFVVLAVGCKERAQAAIVRVRRVGTHWGVACDLRLSQ